MGFDHSEQKELDPPVAASGSSSGASRISGDNEKQRDWEDEEGEEGREGSFITLPDDDEGTRKNALAREQRKENQYIHHVGRLKLRSTDDDLPTDWWFASTAIPLIAATFAPMANLMSIVALVVPWRNYVVEDDPMTYQATSVGYPDPSWCIDLNIASLVCGFVGNLFLLFNFTKRIRYIVALPATIFLFYCASGILIGITVSMNEYAPPGEDDVYSQGYWSAVIAACLYMFNSMILMINMTGYFLGHYPQHFSLTDEQRNLILQTMMFFIWLGGGAGVFSTIEGWSYPDAVYFCDVTILTVGFGDYYPTNDVARGIVFPFSVGGIIILGLMVSSISKFAGDLSMVNVLRKHVENKRVNTLSRVVTVEDPEDQRRQDLEKEVETEAHHGRRPTISSPLPNPQILQDLDSMAHPDQSVSPRDPAPRRRIEFDAATNKAEPASPHPNQFMRSKQHKGPLHATLKIITNPVSSFRKASMNPQKVILMKEEKDRFDAMRDIQENAKKFKKWFALCLSVTAFGILWCVGAVVFWRAEHPTQDMSYFQALYFCYISLLTIGYGDLSPKSNAGKPFFVVWSLIAVPTMTILVSDMGDTVISKFKQGTFKLGDLTILPRAGLWHDIVRSNPWLWRWMMRRAERKRREAGLPVGPVDEDLAEPPLSIEQLANQQLSQDELIKRLAWAIRRTADDLQHSPKKRYSYEEWCEFTRLIRFSKVGLSRLQYDEEVDGVVEWDWLEENSPMLSGQSEPEWVLDRLCESLLRLLKKRMLANGDIPDSAFPLSSTPNNFSGFSFNRRGAGYDEPSVGQTPESSDKGKGVETDPSTTQPQERRRRASGANAVLEFFTGDRSGEHRYADEAPLWSKKAKERMKDNRRASATMRRRGPFGKLQHGGKTGAIGGGRGGAGIRTLKIRHMTSQGEEEKRD